MKAKEPKTNFYRVMKSKGFSSKDLVEKTGLSQPFISQLKHGTRRPCAEDLCIFADLFDCDPREIMEPYQRNN